MKSLRKASYCASSWKATSLHVGNLAVHENHFHIFVIVDHFGTKRYFLLRFAHSRFHLVRSHSLLDARRLGRLLIGSLLLSLVLGSLLLIAALICCCLISA